MGSVTTPLTFFTFCHFRDWPLGQLLGSHFRGNLGFYAHVITLFGGLGGGGGGLTPVPIALSWPLLDYRGPYSPIVDPHLYGSAGSHFVF